MHIEVQIEIPDYVNKLMAKLNDAGYEAWCVGGCVRDSLLGRIPEDWDLAVSSLPPETKQVFSDYPTFDVGMRLGTISVPVSYTHLDVYKRQIHNTVYAPNCIK